MNSYERIYEALISEKEAGKPAEEVGDRPKGGVPTPFGADAQGPLAQRAEDDYLTRARRKGLQARLKRREAGSSLTRSSQRRLTRVGAALRSVVGRNK